MLISAYLVTHLQLVAAVVKPMATLIITRRLYMIASLKSVDLSGKAEVWLDIPISSVKHSSMVRLHRNGETWP